MITTQQVPTVDSDAQLVEWSLTGDRDAFAQIVERYKSLVCSITYGATGNLAWSEDLAQETFLTAWKRLSELREPAKLRSWLCAITRNILGKELRRREPVRAADPLDAEMPAGEPLPSAEAISREEEAILWRALQQIPETYREPMILFYREEESVERVAAELELSEDAVKQRLSRGRKLLTEEVAAFVEGTLRRTAPGKAFTLGVLAALPALTLSAEAAALGATAAKGSATAKAAAATGLLGVILSPLLLILGSYAGYRIDYDAARSDEERGRIHVFYRKVGVFVAGIFAAFAAFAFWLCRNQPSPALLISLLITGVLVIYLVTTFVFAVAAMRRRRKYYSGVLAHEFGGKLPAPAWEYRSRRTFLGLPLVHIRIGDRFDVLRKPVVAWVAAANYAVGGLIAFGEIAVAPISMGWCAVGLLSFGGIAIGLFALGGLSLGVWAMGGLALGWMAYGGCAIAWKAALGGIALAHDYALGGVARGGPGGIEAAKAFIQSSAYFHSMQSLFRYFFWLNLLWVIPLLLMWRVVARAKGRKTT